MSKQHKQLAISNRLRRGLAGILSLALLLGLLPAAVVPAAAAEHWAAPYVQTLTDWGVMRGDISGNMAPERSITRAEFVTMMNRAYGYTRTAGHPFTDVSTRDWYNEDIDIAYNMGYFQGTSPTTASPNSPLTREQAAVLLARNMMLQPTVGETLGFSDTRTLSEWSRGLVGAATENGIISGYNDGSFKPQANITRGEVAAMLVRAIGTPIQEEGDHTLGNVYGNVTVNTSGVKLRDGVITGNLYLTGGIDLGDVLLENITVLGEIIVSGAGESDSAQSSIVLRNVTANSMSVDNISGQFVTIRAEGNTDIKTTTVRTSAYVDDSTLPGYGLWKIIQDGGSLLQLAGNAKEVVNQTPNSELQIVQGVADKVTIDEKATGSSVLVNGDARVDELDLDVATKVTGEGDIKNLNVGAAGSTVEQLPDKIIIRPGITTDINGSEMDSSQAAEASAEPMLLAGYPKAKNIAPTSATLVFSVNKPGTIYWAISAVSDGSVSEADLIENPAYGGKIIKSGTINATAANTEYTANVTGLTQDGSYYISAILVDGRDKRSPVKVTAFYTPDGTRPAFSSGPTATLRSTKTAQVTGMPNKSCLLYWALLPEGAAAPTAAQFKANAITGNLGYGSMDVVKNVSQTVNVNRGNLKEKTNYVAYLWLTDHDGAQSSQVYRVPIYIPDETPPVVNDVRQTGKQATAVEVSFTMNETGKLHWAIVTDETHEKKDFLDYDHVVDATGAQHAYLDFNGSEENNLAAKIAVMTGTAASNTVIVSGSTNVTAADTVTRILTSAARGLDPAVYNTSTFVVYFVGEDSETPSNLADNVGYLEVNVLDEDPPVLKEQRFNSFNGSDREHPLANTDIELIFSESIRWKNDKTKQFLRLYQDVELAVESGDAEAEEAARNALNEALSDSIRLYVGSDAMPVNDPSILDFRYAQVRRDNGLVITLPHNARDAAGNIIGHAVSLTSGATYHFELYNIYDLAGNALAASETETTPTTVITNSDGIRVQDFRTVFAQVDVKVAEHEPMWMSSAKDKDGNLLFESTAGATNAFGSDGIEARDQADGSISHYVKLPDGAAQTEKDAAANNPPSHIDASFTAQRVSDVDPNIRYDMLIWSDTNMEFTVYARPLQNADGSNTAWAGQNNAKSWMGNTADSAAAWTKVGTGSIARANSGTTPATYAFSTLSTTSQYPILNDLQPMEYAIHVDSITGMNNNAGKRSAWDEVINLRVTFVASENSSQLRELAHITNNFEAQYEALKAEGLEPVSEPEHQSLRIRFTDYEAPVIQTVALDYGDEGDTNPTIRVTMEGDGEIAAVFIPIGNLGYVEKVIGDVKTEVPPMGTSSQAIVESNEYYYGINSYMPAEDVYALDGSRPSIPDIPRLSTQHSYRRPSATNEGDLYHLSAPSAVKILGGIFDDEEVIPGAATGVISGGSRLQVKPSQPLQPDTIYLVCLVPQGSTPRARASDAVCFAFATETLHRPILWLSGPSGTLTNISATARVNRVSTVRAQLVVNSLVGNTVFGEDFKDTAIAAGKETAFSDYLATLPTAEQASFSVLDALQNDYNAGSQPGCSVFDEFASTALKERVKRIVRDGVDQATTPVGWGPTALNNLTGTIRFDLNSQSTIEYVIVGGAYLTVNGQETGEWAFRALFPISPTDDQPPKVQHVDTGNLRHIVDEDGNESIEGDFSIEFDHTLYRQNTLGNLYIYVAQRDGLGEWKADGTQAGSNDASQTNFRGLGGLISQSSLKSGIGIVDDQTAVPGKDGITTIAFTLANRKSNTFSVSFQGDILSNAGGLARMPSGSVEVKWENDGWQITVADRIKSPNYY